MAEKLFHVRIDSRGGTPVNGHFKEADLKENFKDAWWLKTDLEMDFADHLDFFRVDTTKETTHIKRVT